MALRALGVNCSLEMGVRVVGSMALGLVLIAMGVAIIRRTTRVDDA